MQNLSSRFVYLCLKLNIGYTCNIINGETQIDRCPLGTYSVDGGNKCLPAPAGFMCTNPSSEPVPCTDGYYTTTERST
jgi:hypothetical protein